METVALLSSTDLPLGPFMVAIGSVSRGSGTGTVRYGAVWMFPVSLLGAVGSALLCSASALLCYAPLRCRWRYRLRCRKKKRRIFTEFPIFPIRILLLNAVYKLHKLYTRSAHALHTP